MTITKVGKFWWEEVVGLVVSRCDVQSKLDHSHVPKPSISQVIFLTAGSHKQGKRVLLS